MGRRCSTMARKRRKESPTSRAPVSPDTGSGDRANSVVYFVRRKAWRLGHSAFPRMSEGRSPEGYIRRVHWPLRQRGRRPRTNESVRGETCGNLVLGTRRRQRHSSPMFTPPFLEANKQSTCPLPDTQCLAGNGLPPRQLGRVAQYHR
jgi:hypothetical protein